MRRNVVPNLCMAIPVELIAHRGSSFLAPENTLSSFRLGWEETTTSELDVRLTADGKVVVIHDDSAERTTGVRRKVAECSLSELQMLDAGVFKRDHWKGERVPSLEEVIAAMPSGKKLLIEIKTGTEIMPKLIRTVRESGKEKQLSLQCFDPEICAACKSVFKIIPVYLLVAFIPNSNTRSWSPTLEEAIATAKRLQVDGMGVNDTPLIDAAAVESIHSAGLKLNIWTVDDVDAARRLILLGIDGLITNRPGWLRQRLL